MSTPVNYVFGIVKPENFNKFAIVPQHKDAYATAKNVPIEYITDKYDLRWGHVTYGIAEDDKLVFLAGYYDTSD